MPASGGVDPDTIAYCEARGASIRVEKDLDATRAADAIYLNAPRTVAHSQLLRSRGAFNLRIDADFMATLKPHCILLDPMQRSGDFAVEVQDDRLAFYRQSENALVMRMAILAHLLGGA